MKGSNTFLQCICNNMEFSNIFKKMPQNFVVVFTQKTCFFACFQYQISISECPKRLQAYNKYVLVTTEVYTFTFMQKQPMWALNTRENVTENHQFTEKRTWHMSIYHRGFQNLETHKNACTSINTIWDLRIW